MSKTTESQERQIQYYAKLLDAIQSVFDEESENYIGLEELSQGDNLTEFIHVLSNSVPNAVYQKVTGVELSNLDFNHIANKLCFQYSSKI